MSTEFRPLSTWALCAIELRNLNPIDTSWSAFNYYIHTCTHTSIHICVHECALVHTQVPCALFMAYTVCIIPIVVTMTSLSSTSSKEVQQFDREESKEVAIVLAAPIGLPPAQPAQATDQGHGTQTSSSRKNMGTGTVCAHLLPCEVSILMRSFIPSYVSNVDDVNYVNTFQLTNCRLS